MPVSVSVGQPVAHPSAVAAVVAAGAPAAAAPKTGVVQATGLTCNVPQATGRGGTIYVSSTTGASVKWNNQPLPTILPAADLT